ncbi:hypothetical protein G9A89_007045 [Geosiphon pyriformis]|nr:hypothetical protein G9A89_007045 [Geosiphon pyriformis]
MEATQYQALVGNNWLSKTNATLDWNMQKLQISQNSQHTRVPAIRRLLDTSPLLLQALSLQTLWLPKKTKQVGQQTMSHLWQTTIE